MKIGDLLNKKPILEALMQRPMPGKLAYAFAKNIRLLNQEIEAFDTVRLKLLEDHHWPFDEKTGQYIIPDEDKLTWRKEYTELLDTIVQITPYRIPCSMIEPIELSPAEALAIDWMLEEEAATAPMAA